MFTMRFATKPSPPPPAKTSPPPSSLCPGLAFGCSLFPLSTRTQACTLLSAYSSRLPSSSPVIPCSIMASSARSACPKERGGGGGDVSRWHCLRDCPLCSSNPPPPSSSSFTARRGKEGRKAPLPPRRREGLASLLASSASCFGSFCFALALSCSCRLASIRSSNTLLVLIPGRIWYLVCKGRGRVGHGFQIIVF